MHHEFFNLTSPLYRYNIRHKNESMLDPLDHKVYRIKSNPTVKIQ